MLESEDNTWQYSNLPANGHTIILTTWKSWIHISMEDKRVMEEILHPAVSMQLFYLIHQSCVCMCVVQVLLVQECLSQKGGSCQWSGPVGGQCPCWLSAGWDAWRGRTAPGSAYLSAWCLPEPCKGEQTVNRNTPNRLWADCAWVPRWKQCLSTFGKNLVWLTFEGAKTDAGLHLGPHVFPKNVSLKHLISWWLYIEEVKWYKNVKSDLWSIKKDLSQDLACKINSITKTHFWSTFLTVEELIWPLCNKALFINDLWVVINGFINC